MSKNLWHDIETGPDIPEKINVELLSHWKEQDLIIPKI